MIDFLSELHGQTARDYLPRVIRGEKAHCAQVAKQYGQDYWDGDRKYGYGGYRYDGRWVPVARRLIEHYGLTAGSTVLDVGCGKAFLLYEMSKLVPGMQVRGLDLSRYALEHAPEPVRPVLDAGAAQALPYPDASFDLVISITTLHNLYINDLSQALREIERVRKASAYIVVESYRDEKEKENLLNWQLTCECFFTPREWEWVFRTFGYTGDYSFIFFQ